MRMQPHKLCAAKYGSFPKLQFYCSLHKDFGVRAWLAWTGSKGGKKTKDPWEGVKFWFDEIPEEHRQIIIREKYFNRPAAVAAKEAKEPGFFEGPFDPNKFLVRIAATLLHCKCAGQVTQPCLLLPQLYSEHLQLAVLRSAPGTLCIGLHSTRAFMFWPIHFHCKPHSLRFLERHNHNVECTIAPLLVLPRDRRAAPLAAAFCLREHWHLMRNHVTLNQLAEAVEQLVTARMGQAPVRGAVRQGAALDVPQRGWPTKWLDAARTCGTACAHASHVHKLTLRQAQHAVRHVYHMPRR